MLLTDVMKRYKTFTGHRAVMLTGTDEHGLKIQLAAAKAKIPPQRFCDQVSKVFRDLPARASVEYDQFIRTSSPEHKIAVEHFWNVLKDRGHIFKDKHEGWYSVNDETFFPSSMVERRQKPGGPVEYYSTESGNAVSWTQEENYHFRLSAFKDRLLEFYRDNPDFVVPRARYDDVVTSVSSGLSDLSISRPRARLTWGIQVPNDDSQTIYVWLDALVNYITAAGYPNKMELWPADVHVIGKDIVRFHCVYWPAFLMAAGIDLPKKIITHSHWTMANFKMSKSRGNVADPWAAIDRFGIDSVRYYLMRDGRLENDGNYSTEHLILRHNHELVNGLGNLVSRVTSKSFKSDTILSHPPPHRDCSDQVRQLQNSIIGLTKHVHECMNQVLIFRAVAGIVDMVSRANTLMQNEAPWSKTCTEERRTEVIYTCLETARIAALLLQPVMPNGMAKLLDRLGVDSERRGHEFAHFGKDDAYRPIQVRGSHLFAPIDESMKPGNPQHLPKIER